LIRKGKDKIENSRPFVIHVSSHSRETESISVSNKLRQNGYDAYFAPVRISKHINIYRVYIGRFTTWEQAHRIVKILGESRLAEYAVVIPYPFALQIGKVGSVLEAKELLERLRQKGISGLLSISNKWSLKGIRLAVYVGAFKKPENAVWLAKKLKHAGFSFKQIRP
jgi:cell division septation protein DedD